MENMKLYDLGRSVPANAQKQFSNGRFSGTDINPMWRIKKLTEMFGPVGFGWYTEVTRQETIPADDGNVMVFVDINLYVKVGGDWSKPIFGTGGNTLKAKGKGDDDGFKKAYTDAMSIACKALGIGADIWYSADADVNADYSSKYSSMYTERGSAEAAQEAGHRKLAEIEKRMDAANTGTVKPDVNAQMATEKQKKMLRGLVNVEQLDACNKKYGPNWERMTANHAEAMINKLREEAASA